MLGALFLFLMCTMIQLQFVQFLVFAINGFVASLTGEELQFDWPEQPLVFRNILHAHGSVHHQISWWLKISSALCRTYVWYSLLCVRRSSWCSERAREKEARPPYLALMAVHQGRIEKCRYCYYLEVKARPELDTFLVPAAKSRPRMG